MGPRGGEGRRAGGAGADEPGRQRGRERPGLPVPCRQLGLIPTAMATDKGFLRNGNMWSDRHFCKRSLRLALQKKDRTRGRTKSGTDWVRGDSCQAKGEGGWALRGAGTLLREGRRRFVNVEPSRPGDMVGKPEWEQELRASRLPRFTLSSAHVAAQSDGRAGGFYLAQRPGPRCFLGPSSSVHPFSSPRP